MDRNTLLAVLLSLAIWYGWLAIRGSPEPPPDADAVVDASGQPAPAPAPAPAPEPVAPPEPAPDTQTVPFTMCGVEGSLSTDGGRIHDLHIPGNGAPYHTMPLYSWLFGWITGTSEWPWRPYGEEPGPAVLLSEDARALTTGAGAFGGPGTPMTLVSEGSGEIALRGRTAGGVAIDKRLTEQRGADGESCWVDVSVTWQNPSSAPSEALWIAMADHTPEAASRYTAQRQPTALVDGSVFYGGREGAGCVRQGTALDDESGPIALPGPVEWFGLSDRYFGSYLVPRAEGGEGSLRFERVGLAQAAMDGAILTFPPLAAGASRTEQFALYIGPNNDRALTAVDGTLGRAVDLGWFSFFGYPLLWLLRAFYSLVGNWGIAIILLTFLVKLIFFPMTQKSFKSMQGMQLIQPELAAIKEQYADNPQEMNRRTLELMQERGVNPLSGCLPMIVQMPVWFALYQVLLTSVELYHTEFLWLRDLTEPDPFLILPVSITFLMWLQQQLSTPAANMDPFQQQLMRYMPLIFGLMFFAFPSGLAVYVFVNITLSILQQWVIKRSSGPPPAPAVATG